MATNSHLRILVYGDIGGSGGYLRYCKGLFGSDAIPTDTEIIFICSKPFYNQIKPLDATIQVITHPWLSSTLAFQRYFWHLMIYPSIVRHIHPDVEFYPSGQLRLYLRDAVSVATCHNLLLFDKDELILFTDPYEYRQVMGYRARQINSFKKAKGVIFVSNHSRQVILNELTGVRLSTVIPHGLDPEFRFTHERTYESGIPINILYVSTILFYKHQSQVVQAVKEVRLTSGLDVRLRLVGGASPSALRLLEETINAENARGFVEMIGTLDRIALMHELQNADLFVFASSCETFGITLLEAMGARLPIACSYLTGLPDILKDAGEYFDPRDSQSIADAICKLLINKERRKMLGEKAFQYSSEFTWERSAQQTFKFIRQVYEEQTQSNS